MVLVILGTQKQPFTRLIDAIQASEKLKHQEVIIQSRIQYDTLQKNISYVELLSYEDYIDLVSRAEFVITHGGTGSITDSLKNNKKVLAVPRLSAYGEHVDDHQKQYIDVMDEAGYLIGLEDLSKLDQAIEALETFKPKAFVSNQHQFLQEIQTCIQMLIKDEL